MSDVSSSPRPNILLIITDQQRADALGISNEILQTPYLDALAAKGTIFDQAVSACPVCVPARRTLMTGKKASDHGVLVNAQHEMVNTPTLPGELSKAGYQTHLVGKSHLFPNRKLYGFDSADWANSANQNFGTHLNDYARFLLREGQLEMNAGMSHGANPNGWVCRPFHLDDKYHFTNWCVDRAIEFLDRRDPTCPFFLKLSFHQPHQPLTPPQYYFDKYMAMDLPKPKVADWSTVYPEPQKGTEVASWRVHLSEDEQKRFTAAYYGCINHIDDQIGRLMTSGVLPKDTIVVFLSDHGEMLGDHQWIRKRNALEGSIRIPFFITPSPSMNAKPARSDSLVEIMDLMPTLLDMVDVPIPDSVTGTSLKDEILEQTPLDRDYVHGECAEIPTLNSGMQFIRGKKFKYAWYPGTGDELFFDLENDPDEMVNLAGTTDAADEIDRHRQLLIQELDGRPESFVQDGKLAILGGPTAKTIV